MKIALKQMDGVAWSYGKVKSPLLGDRRVQRAVDSEIRRWGSQMRCKEKKTVIMGDVQSLELLTCARFDEAARAAHLRRKAAKRQRDAPQQHSVADKTEEH